jgi:hypothetical protein
MITIYGWSTNRGFAPARRAVWFPLVVAAPVGS